ncbi:hypothetical protein CCACVL1_12262 [Corchorus capsularis]|uniref:Uncharacterized protein n=1 Tax=Corchorus capsularis TaxID=210143 RepID=A0A1R3IGK8_COCAP|nr:hypothetical protein CCACVL1_12262 [Corchorus capsularis]
MEAIGAKTSLGGEELENHDSSYLCTSLSKAS